MAVKIKYVGAHDTERREGIHFTRLVPVDVPETIAHKLMAYPLEWIAADAEPSEEALAQREQLGHALIREGKERLKQAQKLVAKAEDLPDDEPRTAAYKAKSLKNAEAEVEHAEGLIEQGKAWLEKVKAEADKPKRVKAEA